MYNFFRTLFIIYEITADIRHRLSFHKIKKPRCIRSKATYSPSEGIFKSTCYIDVRWFPFDVQRCDMKFGSWTYGGWSLDLQMIQADVSGYIANGEWDLVGEFSRSGSGFESGSKAQYRSV